MTDLSTDDVERLGGETIQVPDLCKASIGPLVDLITANRSKAVTEAAVRLAIVIGHETGKAEPRPGEYGMLERSPYPLIRDDWKRSY